MSLKRSKQSQPSESLPPKEQVVSFPSRVSNAYASGKLECGNVRHYFERGTAPSSSVEPKRAQDILAMMMPGDKAKCHCEMRVMERAWNDRYFQKDGVFTSRYVERGSYTLGVADKSASGRKIRQLPYALSSAELGVLHADFRHLWFIPGDDYHDHPVAHTRTMLCAERLTEKLSVSTDPAVPKQYLDLHGNPARNSGYNRRNTGAKITTVVELVSPADAVRKATKWEGHAYLEASMRSLSVAPDPSLLPLLNTLDGSISVHTLYYYDMQEVCAHVNLTGKPLRAIMHRFVGPKGTLNNGEQTWVKDTQGGLPHITQTNVQTGESYVHMDNARWFDNASWAPPMYEGTHGMVRQDGISWTIGMMCPDVYEFTIVPCPAVACSIGDEYRSHGPNQSKSAVNSAVTKARAYELWVGDSKMSLDIDAPTTFAEARAIIAGKPRTEEKWPDHLQSVKRIAAKNKESVDNVVDVALASFFIDFESDARKLNTVLVSNKTARRSFARVLKGQSSTEVRSVVRDILCTAGVVVALVGSHPNKVATGLINHTVDMLDQRT